MKILKSRIYDYERQKSTKKDLKIEKAKLDWR